ncbi:MAG: signal peptidase II [Nitrospirae bacterium]|nr:signal peptidase II [Nitrospirota bacterium]
MALMALIALVVVTDQLTKAYIARSFQLYESTVVIKHFFSLTYTRNPGAAFGFLAEQNGQFRTVFFILISCAAFFSLGYFFMKTPSGDTLSLAAISLILGGAAGNFLDRLQMGEVIDFLDFYIGRHHWWIFNIADSAITVGISLILLQVFLKKNNKESEATF